MTSPGRLRRLTRDKPLKILVLGQKGVGKTALIVRLITQRFIGEYAPIERKYTCKLESDGDQANFEVMDTVAVTTDVARLQDNIRWAHAFLLVYDVTDQCSLDECTRLKFLINHVKRSKRINTGPFGHAQEPNVFLLGNKNDLEHHRVVKRADGIMRSKELNCVASYEISVRESCDELRRVFIEISRFCKGVRTPDGPRSPETQRRSSGKDAAPSPRPRSAAIISVSPSDEQSVQSNKVYLVPEVIVQQEDMPKQSHAGNSISKRILWKMLPARWSKESDNCKSESDSS